MNVCKYNILIIILFYITKIANSEFMKKVQAFSFMQFIHVFKLVKFKRSSMKRKRNFYSRKLKLNESICKKIIYYPLCLFLLITNPNLPSFVVEQNRSKPIYASFTAYIIGKISTMGLILDLHPTSNVCVIRPYQILGNDKMIFLLKMTF